MSRLALDFLSVKINCIINGFQIFGPYLSLLGTGGALISAYGHGYVLFFNKTCLNVRNFFHTGFNRQSERIAIV